MTRHLAERLGAERVAAHHSSLSRQRRFDAEQRLKAGELSLVVATASLELGHRRGHGGSHLPDRLAPLDRHRAAARRPLGPRPDRHAQGPALPAHPRPARRVRGAGARGPPRRDRPAQPAPRAARRPGPADRGDLRRARSRTRTGSSTSAAARRRTRRSPARTSTQVVDMLAEGIATRRGRYAARLHRDGVGATAQGPARRAPGRAHLGRRDPRQRELRGRAGARRDHDRLARRGLRDRVHGGRRHPARQQLVAHPPHRERPRARRGRGRRAAPRSRSGSARRRRARSSCPPSSPRCAQGVADRLHDPESAAAWLERETGLDRRGAAARARLHRGGQGRARRGAHPRDRGGRALLRRGGRHAARGPRALRRPHQPRLGHGAPQAALPQLQLRAAGRGHRRRRRCSRSARSTASRSRRCSRCCTRAGSRSC